METILKINQLSKHFGKNKAVDQLSFEIQKGHVYGILGPNGSGKSTTLGMVLNVVNPTSGTFSWFNGNIDTHDALKKIGAIIEHPNFYPSMSALENLELVAKIKCLNEPNYQEKLDLVGLWERRFDAFRTYSLGMKQRLAIASALLNDPEILILDEPTNGLDPQGIHQIRDIIKKIAEQGTTILLASHLLDEVEKICSHVIILRQGKMIYDGSVESMNASHGFFEVAAENKPQLLQLLESEPAFESVSELPNQLYKVILKQPMESDTLNKMAFEKGIVLKHLVKRKESLEESFLNLTKNE
ncbi:ABC transporter ATP-binding protein [Psychroflexus planctonicus]|uniref:ABC transporter ATP-binding protein n=1 Tax=Psychroflexus planctonicus TaxID=1526575 RepID=UPI00166A8834|nr:ABC transporter ATP-binding protein [Psychroflexus planctonicus]